MPNVNFLDDGKTVDIKYGETVLLAAKKGRVALSHKCGGKGSCTTCKVKIVDQEGVSEPNHLERRMISETNLQQGQRLGCQIKVYNHVDILFLEDPLKALIRRQLAQQRENNE
jgi:2Fe-2S ferredoxin